MSKISVYLISIETYKNFNGVDRHIQVFMDELVRWPNVECFYLAFTQDPFLISPKQTRINKKCLKVMVPLPVRYGILLKDMNSLQSYNREVYGMIKPFFLNKKRRVIHVHTLNMMPLALFLKSRFRCKIVSHIHCLPWKYNLALNPKVFGKQYEIAIRRNEKEEKDQLFSVLGEKETYNQSDCIICVSDCGEKFVKYMQETANPLMRTIPNGICDAFDARRIECGSKSRNRIVILFAGGASKGKGLEFLLEGINILPDKVKKQVDIHVAGVCGAMQQTDYKRRYKNIRMIFMGKLGQLELEKEYYRADIGAIMSLHEQCSYTAIEMMMHQLPVISTDADGLGEMFQDNINALTVPVVYNEQGRTLAPDINVLSKKLLCLIHDSNLRRRIGRKGRLTFLECYTAGIMSKRILELYEEII